MVQLQLEYQKGCDNTVADALSQVITRLDLDTGKSILDRVTLGSVHQAKVHDPTVVEGDCSLKQEVCVTTGHTLVQMHFTDWAETQKEDPMLKTVLNWLKAQKKTNLKAYLMEHASRKEGKLLMCNWQNFTVHQDLCICAQCPKGETEDLLLFVVPKAHWVTALNGCHQDAGHQGHDCILSLLWECFWWSGMTNQMQQSIKSCVYCLQHEGDVSKAPLHLIVATSPLDLLHVDFTSIEMTMELNRLFKVTSVLVFQDHFTKHIMAYVTPNQTAKTVTKFLYQGYILTFGALARLLSD